MLLESHAHSLSGRNDKRPDGATQIPWKRAVWFGTPPAPTHTHNVLANSRKAGSAATEAELKKLQPKRKA